MTRIKELREKTGLTQREFAEKYDIKLRTLQNWEIGHRKTNATVLRLIEKQMNGEIN